VARSTDTGPQLADVHGELGWRRPDGSFHHLDLTEVNESIVDLAPDAEGGVWFAAYAQPSSVYGHVDAAGTLKQTIWPKPLDCPTCQTEVPQRGLYAGLVAVGPANTIWLEGLPNCMIQQVDTVTGRIIQQFTDADDGGYDNECNDSAPLDGGGLAIPMHARVAFVTSGGMTITALPGEQRWAPLAVTTSASGILWCIASHNPADGVIAPTLYQLPRTGPIQVSHPFPSVGLPPWTRFQTPPRATMVKYDLNIKSISAANDGGLWFTAGVSVWHLG